METELAYGDIVLRLDGPVIEVLSTVREGSLRIHANHAYASLLPSKHGDRLEVKVGARTGFAAEPQGPIVVGDERVTSAWGGFKVALQEEARLREFFAEAERRRVPWLGPVDY